MFSGYGELSDDDMAQPPEKVLSEHETTVRSWLMSLSKKDLQLQVNLARDHKEIKKFIGFYGRDRKFAGAPDIIVDDLCEFDVWLKKLALSESKHPVPPAKPAFTPLDPPKPAPVKPSGKKAPKKPDPAELPQLSEADQELYKDWWGKYQTTPEQASPATESAPATTTTKRAWDPHGGQSYIIINVNVYGICFGFICCWSIFTTTDWPGSPASHQPSPPLDP